MSLARWWRGLKRWWSRRRPPPWLDIGPCDPFQHTSAGEHRITLVSRHDIAEAGLRCPHCLKPAAERGDFAPVRETRLGEAVPCEQCGSILLCGPDTEHGDHLRCLSVSEERRFVRIAEDRALRECYGIDMLRTATGDLVARKDPTQPIPEQKG